MKKKFGDTKLGTFLKEKAPNVLNTIGHLAGESGIPIVSTIGHVVDSMIPDMKEEIQPLIDDYEKNEFPLLMADLADARNREVQIATSDKAPLISKIILPVLAIVIVTLTFAMWYMVLYKDFKNGDKEIVLFILGSLSTMCAGVVQYFFGSSAGSRDKSETIKKLIQ